MRCAELVSRRYDGDAARKRLSQRGHDGDAAWILQGLSEDASRTYPGQSRCHKAGDDIGREPSSDADLSRLSPSASQARSALQWPLIDDGALSSRSGRVGSGVVPAAPPEESVAFILELSRESVRCAPGDMLADM